jgi:hypothetical protein
MRRPRKAAAGNIDGKEKKANQPQHVRHDEESDVRSANVHLIQVADSAVARSNGDVLELNVHVVLSCAETNLVSMASLPQRYAAGPPKTYLQGACHGRPGRM